jgi:hypothetical protein
MHAMRSLVVFARGIFLTTRLWCFSTGKSHTEREGTEQKFTDDDKRRDPRFRPKSKAGDLPEAPGHDLSLAEFTELYKEKVSNEKQPHGHLKAFMAMDKNDDNVLQPHELNALERWIRQHPDL